jgi:hypothetical protein
LALKGSDRHNHSYYDDKNVADIAETEIEWVNYSSSSFKLRLQGTWFYEGHFLFMVSSVEFCDISKKTNESNGLHWWWCMLES